MNLNKSGIGKGFKKELYLTVHNSDIFCVQFGMIFRCIVCKWIEKWAVAVITTNNLIIDQAYYQIFMNALYPAQGAIK